VTIHVMAAHRSKESSMPTLTFPEIHARVAEHYATEAIRNAPKPAAIRAVYALGSLLADLDAADRDSVLNLLREEILSLPVTA
jgi:hypothetical protein